MHNGGNFSRAAFGLEVKDVQRPGGKSCGYYLRIIFFFSSLIQSLIIVSLVLFLVYGQPEQSAEGKRVRDLERSLKELNSENRALKQQERNFTEALARKDAEKNQCEVDKKKAELRCSAPAKCPSQIPAMSPATIALKAAETKKQQLESTLRLLESNFSRTSQELRRQAEDASKALAALRLEKQGVDERLKTYARLCKEDFAGPLKGIQDVTKAFLEKVDILSAPAAFPLNCESQRKQIEKVRSSCTELSKEVEEKFQRYLDNVGEKVSGIQGERSRLMVENAQLADSVERCTSKRVARALPPGTGTKEGWRDPQKQEHRSVITGPERTPADFQER